ncbi:MAG: diguanylate cyclase, partial [Kordiimonas sp.]
MSLSQHAFAASTLHIDAATQTLKATPYINIIEDPNRQYDAEHLFDDTFNRRFQALNDSAANFGFSKSDWWVRLQIKNTLTRTADFNLLLDYPLLDFVDVWVTKNEEVIDSWQTGNRRPFGSRPVAHRDFLFPLSLQPEEPQTIYIRVRTQGPVNIGLSISADDILLGEVELEYLAFGAYFGGFFLLALCVALLYLVDHQKALLYYLSYILSYSCYMMTFNGLAFQYLWPNTPEFGQVSRPLLLTLSIIFLLQFSRTLLGIRRVSPRLHQVASALQVALVAILLLIPFVSYGALVMPLAVLNLMALCLIIWMGILAHKRGEPAARYYLIAWSVFLIGLFAYLLKVFGYLPHNFATHYGFQIGSFFEFIFLSVALGVRIKELRHQSHIDELTGLSNRRSFDHARAEEFALSTRPDAELSLLVIDVDHFKRFNDEHGHAAGDKVLQELGEIFKTQIRRPGSAYRYGGGEIFGILPRTGCKEAQILYPRLRGNVEKKIFLQCRNIRIVLGKVLGGGYE